MFNHIVTIEVHYWDWESSQDGTQWEDCQNTVDGLILSNMMLLASLYLKGVHVRGSTWKESTTLLESWNTLK